MQYVDTVYGSTSFSDPMILDLIQSEAMQRLQGVLQHGITAVLGITKPITRFEHSVGAMILVQRAGGSVCEQAAALMHDVSHTAFSHVADFVFGGPHSYHEEKRREWMAQSDIPAVLSGHGVDWTDFLDDERFPLLEQPSPRLCADRLDYFLRDSLALGVLTQEQAKQLYESLVVGSGRFAARDIDAARLFGYKYMEADQASWSNKTAILLYELTARALRTAFDRAVVAETDLWGGDRQLWDKISQSQDPAVAASVNLILRYRDFVVVESKPDHSQPTITLKPKIRTIDPDVVTERGMLPLSALDAEFRAYRDNYLKTRASTISLRLAD
jgi:HD superfamily phosphohydrolase